MRIPIGTRFGDAVSGVACFAAVFYAVAAARGFGACADFDGFAVAARSGAAGYPRFGRIEFFARNRFE